MRLTNPEAVRTIRDTPVLHRFLDERNPSDLAKEIGMPANLVHHHVKRGVELGLLTETKREGKRIYYQLTAKEFTHGRDVLEYGEKISAALNLLSSGFLPAYAASEALYLGADDPDYHAIGFVDPESLPPKPKRLEKAEVQAYPAHFQARTIRLSPAQYQRLLRELSETINDAAPELNHDAKPCTLTLIGYQGELREGHDNAEEIASFLSPPQS